METLKKNIAWIIATLSTIGALYMFVYQRGASSQSIEGRTFDSPEQKVTVVKHVEEGPTPEQQQRAYILDSINTANAIKSRARRDSILVAETKARKYADSINRLNADQLYQTKEEIKQIKELLKDRNQ